MAGPVAMLADTLAPSDFAVVTTVAWAMERKWDGRRLLVTTGPDGPAAFNREGVKRALPKNLVVTFESLENKAVFDGEYTQGRYVLFDLPTYDGVVTPATPWARRQMALHKLLDLWSPPDDVIDVVSHVREPAAKLELLSEIQSTGGEGVVFKRLDGPYEPGPRKSPLWRKHKFLKQVDVVVIDALTDGKRNITLAMADPAGTLILPGGVRGREVGRCSRITGDKDKIQIGDVVTVTVTGVGSSGRLVEPVTPRLRTDKAPEACTIDQLDEIREINR